MSADHTPNALATLITITTYGSWLRGDRRGWVDNNGVLHEPSPGLEAADRNRLKHSPFRFAENELFPVGTMIVAALSERLEVETLALTIDTWHAHIVVGPTREPISRVVKCAKDAVRYGLRPGRPIWTAGYDKRWCFDQQSVATRIRYVERHNQRAGLGPRPWAFPKHKA